nr:ABC transporter permease [uncultured Sellimonas sp.]
MSFFQLAFRYLKRKKGKTFLLFFVLLIINSMILSTSMILRATNDSKKAMQEKTDSKVVAEINTENAGIDKAEIDQIKELKDVSMINRIGRTSVYPSNFIPITNSDSEKEENQKVAFLSCDDLEKDSPFTDRVYKLTGGKYIGKNTRGIVVHENLAAANGLKIGDSIEVSADNGKIVSAEIIGLFSSVGNTEKRQTDTTTSVNRIENQIFVDTETYCTLVNGKEFYKAVVYTKNPQRISELEKEVSHILDSNVATTSADMLYQQISAPLEQISRAAKVMLLLTMLTGTVVVSLLLCMWSRTRQKEIAIFMSLGKKKREIILQVLVESFLVFLFAVLGAALFGSMLSETLQKMILDMGSSEITFTVMLKLQDIGSLMVLGSFVVFVAICCSVIPTLRANPKEILAKMEG